MTKPPAIFISSGEVSGDVIGAGLAEALLRRQPDATLYGLGGRRMRAAGVRVEFETNHLGTVGVSEPLAVVPGLARAFRETRRIVRRDRPDVAILIGNDGFNLLLSRWLKAAGIRTVSYFPPQVWLWRSLAGLIARSYDSILTCFPEEQQVYSRAGGKATFVGHYLCDLLAPVTPDVKSHARRNYGLAAEARVVALLPGSREYEIDFLTPLLLDTAMEMSAADPSLQFVLPLAEEYFHEKIRDLIQRRKPAPAILVMRDSRAALKACDLALVTSGTATLEAALLGVPMVILYRVASITFGVVKLLRRLGAIESEMVGLPNLLLERMAVPERRQSHATPSEVALLAGSILRDPALHERIREDLAQIAARLGGEKSHDKAASHILSQISGGLSESEVA